VTIFVFFIAVVSLAFNVFTTPLP